MRLLIIESSIEIILRLEEMLSELATVGTIHSAASYEKGLKLFHEKKPDVVLMDIFLPENKSLSLLAEMKTANDNTSFIVLLSNAIDFKNEWCKMLGADHFIDKYHDFERIPAIVNGISLNKMITKN